MERSFALAAALYGLYVYIVYADCPQSSDASGVI